MKLIPEKTVEQWMATSLVDFLGPDTWLWSDSAGWDQHAWVGSADFLSKWVLFELKAPEDHFGTIINTAQLKRYVDGFENGDHPDVLYVLPDPPWRAAPQSGQEHNLRASPWNRRTFAAWSFCVPASDLLELIEHRGRTGTPPANPTIQCVRGLVTYPDRRTGLVAPPLGMWLAWLASCHEPPGTALRSPDLVGPEFADEYEAWTLGPERLDRAAGSLTEVYQDDDGPPRRLMALGF